MYIEGALSGKSLMASDSANMSSLSEEIPGEELKHLQNETYVEAESSANSVSINSMNHEKGNEREVIDVEDPLVNDGASHAGNSLVGVVTMDDQYVEKQVSDDSSVATEKMLELVLSSNEGTLVTDSENHFYSNGKTSVETDNLIMKPDNTDAESNTEKVVASSLSLFFPS